MFVVHPVLSEKCEPGTRLREWKLESCTNKPFTELFVFMYCSKMVTLWETHREVNAFLLRYH